MRAERVESNGVGEQGSEFGSESQQQQRSSKYMSLLSNPINPSKRLCGTGNNNSSPKPPPILPCYLSLLSSPFTVKHPNPLLEKL
ncbi:hypothetical protein QYF36_012362 [Acer negundo]|nr:hypothetical protein QYF36_012362 [Acer negundo]